MAQDERVAPRQLGQLIGQLPAAGHGCALDQDWDHPDAALKGGCDLQADDVVGVVQPPLPVLISGGEPPRADDR